MPLSQANCPPKTSPAWKSLVKELGGGKKGEDSAMVTYFRHQDAGREGLPPLPAAQALLKGWKPTPERVDAFPDPESVFQRQHGAHVTPEHAAEAVRVASEHLGIDPKNVTVLHTPEELDAFAKTSPAAASDAAGLNNGGAAYYKNGKIVAYTPNIPVRKGDASPVDSVYRFLAHERFHQGEEWVKGFAPDLHARLEGIKSRVSDTSLDYMAKRYKDLGDWRLDPQKRSLLAGEWLAEQLQRVTEIPKEGPLAEVFQWLKDLWHRVFPQFKREPHLQELKDMFQAMVDGQKRQASGASAETKFATPAGHILGGAYGAWVHPNGQIDRVQNMYEHATVARKILGKDAPELHNDASQVLKPKGFLHVTQLPDKIVVEGHAGLRGKKDLTAAQRMSLEDMHWSHGKPVVLDVGGREIPLYQSKDGRFAIPAKEDLDDTIKAGNMPWDKFKSMPKEFRDGVRKTHGEPSDESAWYASRRYVNNTDNLESGFQKEPPPEVIAKAMAERPVDSSESEWDLIATGIPDRNRKITVNGKESTILDFTKEMGGMSIEEAKKLPKEAFEAVRAFRDLPKSASKSDIHKSARIFKDNTSIRFAVPVSPEEDGRYLSAAKSGDTETAQRMVDEAAKDIPLYWYRPQFRPVSSATVPKGFETFANDGRKFGLVAYKKALPLDIQESMQLESLDPNNQVNEGKSIKSYSDRIDISSNRGKKSFKALGDVYSPDTRRGGTAWRVTHISPEGTPTGHREFDSYRNARNDAAERITVEESKGKSGEPPILYDTQGNIIPLSERFNPQSKDIRFAIPDREENARRLGRHGAWLDSMGKLHRVDNTYGHADVAEELTHIPIKTPDDYNKVYQKGYVRLVTAPDAIYATLGDKKLSPTQRAALEDLGLAKDKPVYVDRGSQRETVYDVPSLQYAIPDEDRPLGVAPRYAQAQDQQYGNLVGHEHLVQETAPLFEAAHSLLGGDGGRPPEVNAENTAKVKNVLDQLIHDSAAGREYQQMISAQRGHSADAALPVLLGTIKRYAVRLEAQTGDSEMREALQAAHNQIKGMENSSSASGRFLQALSQITQQGDYWHTLSTLDDARQEAAVKGAGGEGNAKKLVSAEQSPQVKEEATQEVVSNLEGEEGQAILDQLASDSTEEGKQEYTENKWWESALNMMEDRARGLATQFLDHLYDLEILGKELESEKSAASRSAGDTGPALAIGESRKSILDKLGLEGLSPAERVAKIQAAFDAKQKAITDVLEKIHAIQKKTGQANPLGANGTTKAKKTLTGNDRAKKLVEQIEASTKRERNLKAPDPLKTFYVEQVKKGETFDEFYEKLSKEGVTDLKVAQNLFDKAAKIKFENDKAQSDAEVKRRERAETAEAVSESKRLVKEQKARRKAFEAGEEKESARIAAEEQKAKDAEARADKKETADAVREAKRLRTEQEARRKKFEKDEERAKKKVDEALERDSQSANREADRIKDKIEEQNTEWIPKDPAKKSAVRLVNDLALKDERTARDRIGGLTRDRFLDEYQGRLADAGVSPEHARPLVERLWDENQRLQGNTEVRERARIEAHGSIKALVQNIFANPLTYQLGPKFVHQQALDFFTSNGLTTRDAERAAKWLGDGINKHLVESQEKAVTIAAEKLGMARPKIDALVKAIRSRLLDPDAKVNNVAKALAEQAGFKELSREDFQKLAQLDQKIAESQSPTEHSLAYAKMAEVIGRARMPLSNFQVLVKSYVNSVLSGLSTIGLHFTQPFFAQATRLGTELVDVMAEARRRPLHEVTDMVKQTATNWLDSYRGYVDSLRVSYPKGAMTRRSIEYLDQMVNLHQTLSDSLEAIKTQRGGGKAMPMHLWRVAAATTDFAHRALLSGVETSGRTMEEFLTRQQSMKTLVRNAGMKIHGKDANVMDFATIVQNARAHADDIARQKLDAGEKPATARQIGRDEALRYIREAVSSATGDPADAERIRKYAADDVNLELGLRQKEQGAYPWDVFHFLAEFAVDAGAAARRRNELLGRMVTGFVSVPARLMDRSLYFTPVGLARTLAKTAELKRGENKLYASSIGSPEQLHQRMIEGGVGTMALSMLVPLIYNQATKQDDPNYTGFRVTLAGPKNAVLRGVWKEQGNRAGAIEWVQNGKVVAALDYARGGPESLKIPLIALGTLNDMHLNGTLENKDVVENVGEYLKEAFSGGMKEAAFFGLKSLAEIPSLSTQSDKSVASNLAYLSSGIIPWSGMVRSLSKLATGPLDQSSVRAALVAQTPFASLAGRPAINFLGDPLNEAAVDPFTSASDKLSFQGVPVYIGIAPDSPNAQIYNLLAAKGHAPSAPSRSALAKHNGLVEDSTWERFVRTRGTLIKDSIKSRMEELRQMPSADFEREMSRVSAESTREAKIRLGLL